MLRVCDCVPEKSIYCEEARRLWREIDKAYYAGYNPRSPEYEKALANYRNHIAGRA